MKKGLKNSIMIGMILVLIGTSVITYGYASEKSRSQPSFSTEQRMPEMNGSNPLENFRGNNRQLPNGPQQNGAPEMPDNAQPNDSQTPDTQNDTQSDDSQTKSNDTEQSSGDSTKAQASGTSFEPSSEMKSIHSSRSRTNTVSTLCYMFLALQLAIIILLLSYLAFSKFNALSFKQTYSRFMK